MSNKIQNIFAKHYPIVMDSLPLSREMKQAAMNIIKCRTPVMNIHFEECPQGCGFYVLYDSCRHRGCPQCQESENLKWLHYKKQLLLPGSHIHFVFKLPVPLAPLWLYNKRETSNCLFKAIKKSFENQRKKDGLKRGILLTFHSSGKGLSYHPHVHCLVSKGGFNQQQKWVEKYFSYNDIEDEYRKQIKKALIGLVKKNGFIPPPEMDCIKEILTLKNKSWRIYQSQVYKTGEGVLTYLSKKIKSGPITENDIVDYNDKEVTLKYGEGNTGEVIKLKIKDFIFRYLNHIPPKGFMVVRNLGLYSNRKIKEIKEYKKLLGIKIDESKWEPPKWVCPKCGNQVVPVDDIDKKKLKNYFLKNCA
jgi:hypothetical protein